MTRRRATSSAEKARRARQNQYDFDAYRVIDTVIMGNKPLWAALEERENIYNKPEMTDADGGGSASLKASSAKRTAMRPNPTPQSCYKA